MLGIAQQHNFASTVGAKKLDDNNIQRHCKDPMVQFSSNGERRSIYFDCEHY